MYKLQYERENRERSRRQKSDENKYEIWNIRTYIY